jgi:hypothetical protein
VKLHQYKHDKLVLGVKRDKAIDEKVLALMEKQMASYAYETLMREKECQSITHLLPIIRHFAWSDPFNAKDAKHHADAVSTLLFRQCVLFNKDRGVKLSDQAIRWIHSLEKKDTNKIRAKQFVNQVKKYLYYYDAQANRLGVPAIIDGIPGLYITGPKVHRVATAIIMLTLQQKWQYGEYLFKKPIYYLNDDDEITKILLLGRVERASASVVKQRRKKQKLENGGGGEQS